MIDSNLTEHWLHCQLDRGMFSDEVAVTFPAEGEPLQSVFVPASAVRGEFGKAGSVRVKLLRKSNQLFAELPTSQREIVAITEDDVTALP